MCHSLYLILDDLKILIGNESTVKGMARYALQIFCVPLNWDTAAPIFTQNVILFTLSCLVKFDP